MFDWIKKLFEIPREQKAVKQEQASVSAEQAAVQAELNELFKMNSHSPQFLERKAVLDNRIAVLNERVENLNHRVGNLNQRVLGNRLGF